MTGKNALYVDRRETCIVTMFLVVRAEERDQRQEASKYGYVVSIMESFINIAILA